MTAWTVLSVIRVIDGDSLILIRTRDIGTADNLRITATDAQPVPVRLVHLDTPERGEVGWGEAKRDLEAWIARHTFAAGGSRLTLHTAGRDNFGRLLADLHTPDGDTATLHMTRDKGWPVWQEK